MVDFIKYKILQLPVQASEHGGAIDNLIVYVHWLMAVLFVGWLIYFLYALHRFRQSRNPKADPVGVRSHLSSYVEVGVALIEAGLLIGFSVPLWAKAVEKLPAEKDSTVIRLSAQQFAWNARYAGPDGKFGRQDPALVSTTNPLGVDPKDPDARDDVQVINDLFVPVGKDVVVHVSSMDVIHSFKLLSFRITQDAIPGLSIPVHFKPTRTGAYNINCAQLCGGGHYAMKGQLSVVSQEEFDRWIASKSAGSAPPPAK